MNASEVTVTDSPTQLDSGPNSGSEIVILRNASGAMFIGGPDVDTTDGFPYSDSDSILAVPVDASGLFAIVASGTQTVKVLRTT